MRKFFFVSCLSLLLTGAVALQPAHAQLEQVQQSLSPSSFENLTSEDWIVLGAGAVLGGTAGYFLVESGILPAVELLGMTEGTLGPTAGAVLGFVLTKMGYLDSQGTVAH